MKISIETVVYRVTNKEPKSIRYINRLEKNLKKLFPQTLWVSLSAETEGGRENDIMVSACEAIPMNKIKELIN